MSNQAAKFTFTDRLCKKWERVRLQFHITKYFIWFKSIWPWSGHKNKIGCTKSIIANFELQSKTTEGVWRLSQENASVEVRWNISKSKLCYFNSNELDFCLLNVCKSVECLGCFKNPNEVGKFGIISFITLSVVFVSTTDALRSDVVNCSQK